MPGALFCESCGYDFTTGALPSQDLHTELGLSLDDVPVAPPAATPETSPRLTPAAGSDDSIPAPSGAAAPTVGLEALLNARPQGVGSPTGNWVAEVWIDPQWYAAQESDDPLPPTGAPQIVPLRDSALIGRYSASRNIHPDIDCGADTGCSRRQAYLNLTDGHWYINDLDSANGTYVAPASDPVPEKPIKDRTLVTPDDRVYVGAWTRIVVRPAIEGDLPTAA
jgi:hypothetical protein